MKVFVDNDVILDVLLEREEFAFSRQVLSMIETKQVKGYTTPLIFTNSFYIISKVRNKKKALSALQKLRLLFHVSTVDEKIIDFALASEFTDFEDAVQYFAAIEQKVDYLITRNKKDYLESKIPIVTPEEFCALM